MCEIRPERRWYGRVVFDNIRKFVLYLFSCNVAEVLVLMVAGVAGLPLPLWPLQLLWLNMITDTFPALALAMEPAESNVMTRPPRRPDEAILSGPFLLQILMYGSFITVATMGAFLWALAYRPMQATTIAFMTLALAQILHLGNARRRRPVLSAARAASNPYAVGAVLLSAGLQVSALYIDPLPRPAARHTSRRAGMGGCRLRCGAARRRRSGVEDPEVSFAQGRTCVEHAFPRFARWECIR